ncbi:MAG: MerR family transcriptional regulator [Actinobacteria bacterium]|nr:MAG: MerR family transcriptional regulator [Actinomycetota bacterium]
MPSSKEPLYMIGIAAKKAKVHPQTLRLYEREKLVRPQRTGGSTRLYSDYDIECVIEIQHLTQDKGLNLAGVRVLMDMKEKALKMAEEIKKYQQDMIDLQKKMEEEIDNVHKSYKNELVLYKQSPIALLKAFGINLGED